MRSRPYFSRAWKVSSGVWLVTRWTTPNGLETEEKVIATDLQAVGHREKQVLDREVLVGERRALVVGPVETGRAVVGRSGRSPPWALGSLARDFSSTRASTSPERGRPWSAAEARCCRVDRAAPREGGRVLLRGWTGICRVPLPQRVERFLGFEGPLVWIERHNALSEAASRPIKLDNTRNIKFSDCSIFPVFADLVSL